MTSCIRDRALELFNQVGIAAVESPLDAAAHFEAWIAEGMHGSMAWLATERHRERRADLERILPGVRSAIVVALCHDRERDPARDQRLGRIARYAGGEDYHRLMRERLGALEDFVQSELPGARTLGYSDTGAILERAWAQRAGLGWIGRHSGLIAPKLGSYFVLGELLVDRVLEPDAPFEREHCGTCRRCIDACPTGAIVAPGRVDARRCISYLTIELRGPIPRELRPAIGEWIFGCDVCQEVCPWNRFAPPAREARLHARALEGWSLEHFLELDEATFRELFATSPIRRAKRGGFLRNVCVALGNRGVSASLPALARALGDADPLVRGHAAWAIGAIVARLAATAPERRNAERALRERADDPEPFVRDEASAALESVALAMGAA